LCKRKTNLLKLLLRKMVLLLLNCQPLLSLLRASLLRASLRLLPR
jgi:hypothetical protein